jgi:hypothetical protein
MKKHSLCFLVAFMVLVFGCEDSLVFTPPVSYPPKPPVVRPPITTPPALNLSAYRVLSKNLVNYNFSESNQYFGGDDHYGYIDYEQAAIDMSATLNQSFAISGFDPDAFAHDLAGRIDPVSYDGSALNILSLAPEFSTYYNSTQINALNIYFNSMYDVTSAIMAENKYATAKESIENNGSLTSQQKIAVIGILEYSNEFAKGYFNGGLDQVYQDVVSGAGQSNGRIAACPVNWKDVWRSAVAGGVVGGVRGVMIGAAGGTVTVPGVGTATGAVGGGIFGFATGFAYGGGGALIQQIFWNCVMASPISGYNPYCDPDNYPQGMSFNQNAKCTQLSVHKAMFLRYN